ncbi:MAG: hypothetical protein JNK45_05590 [Myxococcales bacterium]|nr:hypothetical protein [Myxococcales bacterium]
MAAHLGLTIVYNLPSNPARQQVAPLLDAYIGRYFAQNWRMFAPTPASSNLSVLAVCLAEDEFDRVLHERAAGAPLELGERWVDLTAPLVRGHQGARFSAYDRLGRAQITAARGVASLPGHLELATRSCHKGDEIACEIVESEIRAWREGSSEYLRRVASSYCLATAPQSAGVALAVREYRAIPWSKRLDSDATPERTDRPLGVFELAGDVMPAPIYRP